MGKGQFLLTGDRSRLLRRAASAGLLTAMIAIAGCASYPGLSRLTAQSTIDSSGKSAGLDGKNQDGGIVKERVSTQPGDLLENIKIEQRHAKSLNNIGDGENLFMYIGDIHSRGFSNSIIFINNQEYGSKLNEGKEMEYDYVLNALRSEDIILDIKVEEGVEITFNYEDNNYFLKVPRVLWQKIGPDYMEIEIFRVHPIN